MVRDAAAERSGERHVRFVHDADCVIDVANVTRSPGGDDTLDATIAELSAQGFERWNRKYLVFVDANVYCGIAEIEDDDSAGSSNANNKGPHVARVDAGCWSGAVAAHELMHTLGAVQLSAPHSSGDWHCTDSAHDRPIDCELDDYFDPSPAPGRYLATHWNVARNRFLVTAPQHLWGYVSAERQTTASYTPDPRRSRNSTNATNTVRRTAPGPTRSPSRTSASPEAR
jgi:hypothetical protein